MALERYTSLQPAADLPQLTAALERNRHRNGASASRGWYSIKNLSEAEAEVSIYDFVGTGGVTADDFIHELNSIKAPRITLRVNSPGGDVFDGIAIFNAIQRHKAEITAWVDGIAASAASFIVMAADRVVMSPHSQMMIHDAHGLCLGPADDMRKMANILDKSSDNIARIYARRSGGTVEEWRGLMKAESWFSDHEAVAVGLADRVDGEEPNETKIAAELGRQRDAEWTAAFINDLPDSAFAYIESGGEKDSDGRTVPRSLRHFPHHNAEGAVDLPHLRNALARAPQSPFGDDAMPHLRSHAEAEGVGDEHKPPEPLDYRRLFDKIAEEADEAIFAREGV